jgi:hypothetical protein
MDPGRISFLVPDLADEIDRDVELAILATKFLGHSLRPLTNAATKFRFNGRASGQVRQDGHQVSKSLGIY